jgi:hypothetical protein
MTATVALTAAAVTWLSSLVWRAVRGLRQPVEVERS